MYHQFNNLTGRLIRTDLSHPANGIPLSPLSETEPSKIMFESSQVKLSNVTAATVLPGTPDFIGRTYSTVPENIRRSQILFQAKNNLPVFLKGGALDRGLYGVTMILCVVGMAGIGKLIYDLGFVKKQ